MTAANILCDVSYLVKIQTNWFNKQLVPKDGLVRALGLFIWELGQHNKWTV